MQDESSDESVNRAKKMDARMDESTSGTTDSTTDNEESETYKQSKWKSKPKSERGSSPESTLNQFINDFWSIIRDLANIDVPLHIKNILQLVGLDNHLAFKKVTDETITEIESFARTKMPKIIKEPSKMKEYFGIFYTAPAEFEFMIGEKYLIKEISEIVKNKETVFFNKTLSDNANKKRQQKKEKNSATPKSKSLHKNINSKPTKTKISIVDEQKELTRLIKNAFSNLTSTDFNEETKAKILNNLKIQVEVKEKYDENNLANDFTYVACLKCPLCTEVKKITKCSGESVNRWVISNFVRHVNTHAKNPTKKKDLNYSNLKSQHSSSISEMFQKVEQKVQSHHSSNQCKAHTEESKEKDIQQVFETATSNALKNITDNFDNLTQNEAVPYENNLAENRDLQICSENQGESSTVFREVTNLQSDSSEDSSAQTGAQTSAVIGKSLHVIYGIPKTKNIFQDNTRSTRNIRKMHSSIDSMQSRITTFFPLLNRLEVEIQNNKNLSETLKHFLDKEEKVNHEVNQTEPTSKVKTKPYNNFLNKLLELAVCNTQDKKKGGLRYDNDLKQFATYLFIIGGRMLYETLCANLPLPSLSTISRNISHKDNLIIEGELRVKDLKSFLVSRELPLIVWISEDATRITGRIQYDPKTNNIVGFVLPFNNNGMPIKNSFVASSAHHIEKYFETEKIANLAYVIVVEPLAENTPSFCLSLFGTNNKFNTEDVINRWKYTLDEFKKENITVLGISSDGDARLLKAMRAVSKLGLSKPNPFLGFKANLKPSVISIQDTVHIATKLRNRLLKPSLLLPLGDFLVSPSHLRALINNLSKDKHCLTATDISLKDKMNFSSALKICQPKVCRLLQENVVRSNGTVSLLKIMFMILQSFLSKKLSPEERIYNIWFAIYFLRFWRSWLSNNKQYSVVENFITLNCYLCIEMNGHGLISIILRLNEQNSPHLFMPWKFSSQPCESFFRHLRAMSSTNSTIVNFSMLDTLHRVRRIELQNEISSCKVSDPSKEFNFTRSKRVNLNVPAAEYNNDYICSKLPDSNEINKVLEKAKRDAFEEISSLGLVVNIAACETPDCTIVSDLDLSDSEDCFDIASDIECEPSSESSLNLDHDDAFYEDSEHLNLCQDLTILTSLKGTIELKTIDENKIKLEIKSTKDLKVDSPFTVVKDSVGNESIVRKSSICWLLNKDSSKLSSDRLVRVRENEIKKVSNKPNITNYLVKKCTEIYIGEWCLFEKLESSKKAKKCLVGLILSFAYLDGKTWKTTEYSKDFAETENNSRTIGVLCNWFEIKGKELIFVPMDVHGYFNIKQYRFTISAPSTNEKGLILHDSIIKKISKYA